MLGLWILGRRDYGYGGGGGFGWKDQGEAIILKETKDGFVSGVIRVIREATVIGRVRQTAVCWSQQNNHPC